jgi:hypothetical protein
MYMSRIHSRPAAAKEPPKSFRAFRVSCKGPGVQGGGEGEAVYDCETTTGSCLYQKAFLHPACLSLRGGGQQSHKSLTLP